MSNTISPRTPDGLPGLCPVCESLVCIDATSLTGDAPCPHCGHPLWFVNVPPRARCYRREDISRAKQLQIEAVLRILYSHVGLKVPGEADGSALDELDLDSLDLVELVLELEEELDITIAEEAAGRFRTLGDLIDYLVRELPD
jgi:acyl carrier protein